MLQIAPYYHYWEEEIPYPWDSRMGFYTYFTIEKKHGCFNESPVANFFSIIEQKDIALGLWKRDTRANLYFDGKLLMEFNFEKARGITVLAEYDERIAGKYIYHRLLKVGDNALWGVCNHLGKIVIPVMHNFVYCWGRNIITDSTIYQLSCLKNLKYTVLHKKNKRFPDYRIADVDNEHGYLAVVSSDFYLFDLFENEEYEKRLKEVIILDTRGYIVCNKHVTPKKNPQIENEIKVTSIDFQDGYETVIFNCEIKEFYTVKHYYDQGYTNEELEEMYKEAYNWDPDCEWNTD